MIVKLAVGAHVPNLKARGYQQPLRHLSGRQLAEILTRTEQAGLTYMLNDMNCALASRCWTCYLACISLNLKDAGMLRRSSCTYNEQ